MSPELAYYPLAYLSNWAAAINSALMSRDLFRPLRFSSQHKKRSVAAAHTFSAFVDDDWTGHFLLASRAAECQRIE